MPHNTETPRILYDTTVGGVRIVKAELYNHIAAFTCNQILRHCTVQISGKDPFGPDIIFKDGKFAMIYQYLTVTTENAACFEDSYAAAKAFCEHAGPELSKLRTMIEDGRELTGRKA